MFPAKGSLLIFGHRVNRIVLNRCRKPANADILVPGDTISLIGTTSSHVGFDVISLPPVMVISPTATTAWSANARTYRSARSITRSASST